MSNSDRERELAAQKDKGGFSILGKLSSMTNTEKILALVVFILFCGIAGIGFLYVDSNNRNTDVQAISDEETQKVIESVGRHLKLPDETPTMATIIEVDQLKQANPEFYAYAENGDKLLLYAQRAILYDPEGDIILNVAPIIQEPTTDGEQGNPAEEQPKEENN